MPIASFKSRFAKGSPFQDALDSALFLMTIICAFSILILGIFSSNFNSPGTLYAGLAIVCGLGAGLCLLLVARLLLSDVTPPVGEPRRRTAVFVMLSAYCAATVGLACGTVRFAATASSATAYEEANLESPPAFPAL